MINLQKDCNFSLILPRYASTSIWEFKFVCLICYVWTKYCFLFCLSSYLMWPYSLLGTTLQMFCLLFLQIISVFKIHSQIWLSTSTCILYSRHLLKQTMDHTRWIILNFQATSSASCGIATLTFCVNIIVIIFKLKFADVVTYPPRKLYIQPKFSF